MARKQGELPGVEEPKIEEIETAASNYVDARDKRMRLTTKEIAAKQNLLQVCAEHAKELEKDQEGNSVYRFDDLIVILKPGHWNVKVRTATDPADEKGDE